MVYYLKYRPQTLEEIIGQEQVKLTLKKAFEASKLAHAYLFCGPKGTGKTSTARILAKMVNCEVNAVGPCNKCPTCLSITDGSNMDLIEIDAASNTGVDDIRDLREKIKLAPSSSRKKVYIIDEVHMLSTGAFNALLKTLEEPPAHVLFILATTEVHKIPETILSRVQRLDFKQASSSELIDALKRVVEKEKLKMEEGVLEVLAKAANGSFRDGVKLLDQLASTSEKINLKETEKFLKASSFENLVSLLEEIAAKSPKTALKLISTQLENGVNIKEYILAALDLVRAMIFINLQAEGLVKEDFGSDKFESLSSLAKKFTVEDLVSLADNLQKALEKMRVTSIPSLPLEIAIIESCLINSDSDKPIMHQSDSPSISEGVSNKQADSADLTALRDKWNYILETIKPYNYSLEALLKQAKITDCSESQVILEVPYSFHQRILDAPKSKNLLESVLAEVLGRAIKVSTILGTRPVRAQDLANVEIAADDEVIRIAAEIFNSETVN